MFIFQSYHLPATFASEFSHLGFVKSHCQLLQDKRTVVHKGSYVPPMDVSELPRITANGETYVFIAFFMGHDPATRNIIRALSTWPTPYLVQFTPIERGRTIPYYSGSTSIYAREAVLVESASRLRKCRFLRGLLSIGIEPARISMTNEVPLHEVVLHKEFNAVKQAGFTGLPKGLTVLLQTKKVESMIGETSKVARIRYWLRRWSSKVDTWDCWIEVEGEKPAGTCFRVQGRNGSLLSCEEDCAGLMLYSVTYDAKGNQYADLPGRNVDELEPLRPRGRL